MPPHTSPGSNLSVLPPMNAAIGVLVVDDDETLCKALALVLEDEGYTVCQARNGAQALALLRSVGTPLVVLLDWMMPVMDGLEVLSTVAREQGALAQHAYVFMSAAFPAGLRQLAAITPSVNASVLIKPFTLPIVLDKVLEAAERLPKGAGSAGSGSSNWDGRVG